MVFLVLGGNNQSMKVSSYSEKGHGKVVREWFGALREVMLSRLLHTFAKIIG